MKQTMKQTKTEEPESVVRAAEIAYFHLKFKLSESVPERFGSLGYIRPSEVRSKLFNGVYSDAACVEAADELVNDKVLQKGYEMKDGSVLLEELGSHRVMDDLKSGLVLSETGRPWSPEDINNVVYAIPLEILEKTSGLPAKKTMFEKIRRFIGG